MKDLETLLGRVRSGELPVEEAAGLIAALTTTGDRVEDLGFAQLDVDREAGQAFRRSSSGKERRLSI